MIGHRYSIDGETFGTVGYLVRWFRARMLRDERWICLMATTVPPEKDYFHDYPDSVEGFPDHFSWLYCKRCGRKFSI